VATDIPERAGVGRLEAGLRNWDLGLRIWIE
jgi:hypothetical protein